MNNIKKIIVETYEDVVELDSLAKEILKFFANKYTNMIDILRDNPDIFNDLERKIFLSSRQYYIDRIIDSSQFKNLNEFIEDFDLKVFFVKENMGQNDAEYKKSESYIRLYGRRDEFYETLRSYKSDILNDKKNKKDLALEIFYDSFKDVLVHELQHAYDDYRTNGKFVKNKRTQDFFNKVGKIETKEDLKKYLNMPHEYWARFSQTVSKFNKHDWNEDFNLLLSGFKKDFHGYEYLPEKDQKRIIKALYKLYKLKNK